MIAEDCKELADKLELVRERVVVLETLRSEFVTHGQLERALSELKQSNTQQTGKLDQLCETFNALKISHDQSLTERAQAEKAEREQRMTMMAKEHEAKLQALELQSQNALAAANEQSFNSTVKRIGAYMALATAAITIFTAIVGGALWLVQHAAK